MLKEMGTQINQQVEGRDLNITAKLGDISGQPSSHESGGYIGYAEHWFNMAYFINAEYDQLDYAVKLTFRRGELLKMMVHDRKQGYPPSKAEFDRYWGRLRQEAAWYEQDRACVDERTGKQMCFPKWAGPGDMWSPTNRDRFS
jgi:hypothetical protein